MDDKDAYDAGRAGKDGRRRGSCMPNQWLNGVKEPRMSSMLNLADATGMSVYDLMEVDE